MKIKNGTIKNINQKLLTGTFTFALLTTVLTGCKANIYYEYYKNSEGEYVCDNILTYDNITSEYKDYKIICLESNGTSQIYITKKELLYTSKSTFSYYYYNVFGADMVYSTDGSFDIELKEESDLKDYLILSGEIQKEYTEEDMKEILEQITNEYKTKQKIIKEK